MLPGLPLPVVVPPFSLEPVASAVVDSALFSFLLHFSFKILSSFFDFLSLFLSSLLGELFSFGEITLFLLSEDPLLSENFSVLIFSSAFSSLSTFSAFFSFYLTSTSSSYCFFFLSLTFILDFSISITTFSFFVSTLLDDFFFVQTSSPEKLSWSIDLAFFLADLLLDC